MTLNLTLDTVSLYPSILHSIRNKMFLYYTGYEYQQYCDLGFWTNCFHWIDCLTWIDCLPAVYCSSSRTVSFLSRLRAVSDSKQVYTNLLGYPIISNCLTLSGPQYHLGPIFSNEWFSKQNSDLMLFHFGLIQVLMNLWLQIFAYD